MTREERKHPELIKSSRKLRIAKGSGRSAKEVTKLIDGFESSKKQMKMMQNNPQMMRALMHMTTKQ
jgi:signal recognition particle subunit SRP54